MTAKNIQVCKRKRTTAQGKISHRAALFINITFNNLITCDLASVILQNWRRKGKVVSSCSNRQFRDCLINYFSDHRITREKSWQIRPSVEMTRNSLPRYFSVVWINNGDMWVAREWNEKGLRYNVFWDKGKSQHENGLFNATKKYRHKSWNVHHRGYYLKDYLWIRPDNENIL